MTDMIVDDFDFGSSTGAQVAKDSNKGGDFQREVQFLGLKGDAASIQQGKNTGIFRFVTEYEAKDWMQGFGVTKFNFAWITVAQHYAPTKQKPEYAREGSQWPQKMYAVCRNDKVFAKRYGGDCFLDSQQSKTSDRTWTMAIEREQVIENGQIVGIRDKMREVLVIGDDGKAVVERVENGKEVYAKKWVPAWTVCNQGWKNFFNALTGNASYFKSVLGRDFVVTRSGDGPNDTNYTFIPLDPIQMAGDWAAAAGVQEGTTYDLGMIVGQEEGTGRPIPMVERLYPDMPDLRRIIAERTTDDYYGRWFVPGWLPKDYDPSKNKGSSSGPPAQTGWAPTGGVNQQQGGAQQGYAPPTQPQAPITPQPAQGGAQQGYQPPVQQQPAAQTQQQQGQQQFQQPQFSGQQQGQAQGQPQGQQPQQEQAQQAAGGASADALANLRNRVLQDQQGGQQAEQATPQGEAQPAAQQ